MPEPGWLAKSLVENERWVKSYNRWISGEADRELERLETLCASQARELALLRPVAEEARSYFETLSDFARARLYDAVRDLERFGWQPPREGEE